MSAAWLAPLRARWDQTSPREQAALRVALAVLLLARLWAVALRPAWTALRSAQAQAAPALPLCLCCSSAGAGPAWRGACRAACRV